MARPESIVPPIDKTSKAIRIRLLMLFSMLILIIVAMNEAGKPERWEWMGFEQQPTSVKTIELGNDSDAPATTIEFKNNIAAVFFIRGENLLDEEIRYSTSFIKDEAPRPGINLALGSRIEF